MEWTQPDDIIGQVERLWTQGRLLAAAPALVAAGIDDSAKLRFPLPLRLRRPIPSELGQRFEAIRDWIMAIEDGAKSVRGIGYDITWEEVNTRQLGRNRLPIGVSLATRDDALALIGKSIEAEAFDAIVAATLGQFPALRDWLAKRSLLALDHAQDWPRILDCLTWFSAHPRPDVYLRQIDIAGIDSKFIEARKGVLAELLDVVLPASAVDVSVSGAKAFEVRYGLRAKPALVRFRILDDRCTLGGLTDLTVPVDEFAGLKLRVARVFVVENEITGLAFPAVENSIVVLGLGHAVALIGAARWLTDGDLYYWGDLDTHGFAMLDRLRVHVPRARSMLMDRATLLAHRAQWTVEDAPHIGVLDRLTEPEAVLYADLRFDRLGRSVRLEQERIGFRHVREAVATTVERRPTV